MTKKQDCKIKCCGYYCDGECFVKGMFSNGAICPNYSKKQEQLMICPIKGKCPIIGEGLRCGWQEPHECNRACAIGHNTPGCPACILYEPQPAIKAGDVIETTQGKGIVVEPEAGNNAVILQPATCPDWHWNDECICGDLRIYHTGWTGKCHYVDESANPCKCKYFTPADQPEQPMMPLRARLAEIVCQYCVGQNKATGQCISHPKNIKCLLDEIEDIVKAHDSEVASKAVKEFATKVIETMPLVRIPVKPDVDYPITETAMFTQALNEAFATEYNEAVAHIRAMAEGKE